jgi:hypothetical protein
MRARARLTRRHHFMARCVDAKSPADEFLERIAIDS